MTRSLDDCEVPFGSIATYLLQYVPRRLVGASRQRCTEWADDDISKYEMKLSEAQEALNHYVIAPVWQPMLHPLRRPMEGSSGGIGPRLAA